MPVVLYHDAGSPPCHAVRLVAKALGLNVELIHIELLKGEHMTSEFLKINPQHVVPTLVDDGFVVWESRAIMTYLVSQYGKGSCLYPTEPKARALVDQRLYFDIGTLTEALVNYYYGPVMSGQPLDKAKFEKLQNALKFLDGFLEGQQFAAGSHLTVADISLVATLNAIEASDVDFTGYSNIMRWYKSMKSTIKYYDEVFEEGQREYRRFFDAFKKPSP